MKKNKLLLGEGVTRRFMKLASMGALTENFVDTMEEQDEEELMGPDPGPGLGPEDPTDVGDPDLEGEEDLEGPPMDEEFVEELVSAIAGTIEDVTGVAVNVTGDEEDLEGEEGLEDLEDLEDLEGGEELAGLEGGEEVPEEEEDFEALAEHIARSLYTTAPGPTPVSKNQDLVERLSAAVATRLLNNS